MSKLLLIKDNNELMTLKRALTYYNHNIYKGLKNKGFFIDIETFQTDIWNIHKLFYKIDALLK